jgi:outer membrane protein
MLGAIAIAVAVAFAGGARSIARAQSDAGLPATPDEPDLFDAARLGGAGNVLDPSPGITALSVSGPVPGQAPPLVVTTEQTAAAGPIAAAPSSAPASTPTTLVDVFRAARLSDATYAAARASLDAAREKGPQGRAFVLPAISGTANYTYNDADNRTIDRDFRFNSRGYGLTLTQPVYRPGNVIQYAQAELSMVLADAIFAQAGQDLMVRSAQVYFDVLAAQDSLAFIRTQKTAIGEQLAQAKRNFDVGTATITDANEAQARFDLAAAQEIAAENELEIKLRALEQLVGRRFDALMPLRASARIPGPDPADIDRWVEVARRGANAVRAQELAVEIARRDVDRQKTGHYPTLDLVATHGRNLTANPAVGGAKSDIQSNTIGLQLAVPIYAGGAVDSRVREARANQSKAAAELDGAKRNAEFTARQAYLGLSNGLAQVRALEQALVSSETALESSKLGYQVGVRINIDVLNAQQQVFQTRRDLSKARYEAILNGLRLKAITGALTEPDLAGVGELLGRD